MKLKLDLHTHVWEAFNFQPPSLSIAEKVVAQIKSKGIDGIAITDHLISRSFTWGSPPKLFGLRHHPLGLQPGTHDSPAHEFRELVDSHFPGEVVILPGWEIEVRPPSNPFDEYQVSEIFLPEGGVFRIYCHPGYYSPNIIIEDDIHGIEIDNYIHNWHIRKPQVEAIAQAHSLLMVEVSDAHNLENIGLRYTEVDLAELYRRAAPQG